MHSAIFYSLYHMTFQDTTKCTFAVMNDEETLFKCFSLPLSKPCGPMTGARLFYRNGKTEFVVWNEEWIYIFNVKDNLEISPSPIKAIEAPNIEDVFHVSNDDDVLFCLNTSGELNFLQIFTSYNVSGGNCGNLRPSHSNVLAVCTNKKGLFCILKKNNDNIELLSCSVKKSDTKIHSAICIGIKSCLDVAGQCSIHFLSGASLTDKLHHQLYPNAEDNCDLMIVCLGSGRVLCVPATNNLSTHKPYHIFSSHSPVTSIIAGAENDIDALHLFLGNNCIIRISPGEFQLEYETFPCKSTKVVCPTSSSSVLLSDNNQAWLINLNDMSSEVSLPIRGILSAVNTKSNQIFVTTLHQTIYLINLSAASTCISRDQDKPDDYENVIKCVNETVQEISETEKSISKEDALIREISLMQRPYLFKNNFPLNVQVHDSENLNYKIVVQVFNHSSFSLGPKLWCMHVKISGKEICESKSQTLLQSFERKSCFRLLIDCHLKNLILPMTVECTLISLLPLPGFTTDQEQWFTIPLEKIKLDVSYFMCPISSTVRVQEYGIIETESEEQVHTSRLILPTNLDIDNVVKLFAQKCSHRPFIFTNTLTDLAFKVHKSKVKLQFDNNEIVIVSPNKDIMKQVKQFLEIYFCKTETSPTPTVLIDESISLKIKVIQKSLKLCIDMAKSNVGIPEDEDAICNLHKILRQTITSCLPEPQ